MCADTENNSCKHAHDGFERDGGELVAESTSAVTLLCQTLCLFGHEVGDHVRRRSQGGGDITQLDMLAAEVDAHVNVARSVMVMAPFLSQRLSCRTRAWSGGSVRNRGHETKVTKEETQVGNAGSVLPRVPTERA